MTKEATLVERANEHMKLKYMTPSKITGQPYQMVPAEILGELIASLASKDATIARLEADNRMKDELLTAAVDDYNRALEALKAIAGGAQCDFAREIAYEFTRTGGANG